VQSIKSCLLQDYVKVRLIVSTVKGDTAVDVARSISPKIIIVESPHPGIYEQLNRALDHLGDAGWYSYFSGNDVCLPIKSVNEINMCLKTGKKICYSNYITTDANLKNHRRTNFPPYDKTGHRTRGNFVSDCAMVKREIIDKYRPFVLKWGNFAYYDFWLRVCMGEGSVFVFNPRPGWYYRIMKTSKHILRKKNPNALKAAMLRSHS
jgi:hypothetical protein